VLLHSLLYMAGLSIFTFNIMNNKVGFMLSTFLLSCLHPMLLCLSTDALLLLLLLPRYLLDVPCLFSFCFLHWQAFCHCDKIPEKNHLNRGKIYFDSCFKGFNLGSLCSVVSGSVEGQSIMTAARVGAKLLASCD
jgi:hypothetical protein